MNNPNQTSEQQRKYFEYLKYMIDYGPFNSNTDDHRLVGDGDNKLGRRKYRSEEYKWTCIYTRDTAFIWMSKKQPNITLSTCEAEYLIIMQFKLVVI